MTVFGADFKFLRIRNSKVFTGHSSQFKEIIIIDSVEKDLDLMIFIPNEKGQINLDTMHENVKNSLKTFQIEKSFEPGDVGVWLP
jgi:hypothetical protein